MKGKFGIVALLLSSLTFAAPVSAPNNLSDTPIISGGSGTCGRVDLTHATRDYMLQPCEEAVIRFTNQMYVPLRIAIPQPTSPNQPVVYEVLTFIHSSNSRNFDFILYPNNTAYPHQFWYLGYMNWDRGSWYRQIASLSYVWLDTFEGLTDSAPYFNRLYVIYYGRNYPRHIVSQAANWGSLAIHTTVWNNRSVPWTSLGTVAVNSWNGRWGTTVGYGSFHLISGQIIVRRIS